MALTGSLVLLGCGKMGSAMLAGWLAKGLRPDRVVVIDPAAGHLPAGVRVNPTTLPEDVAVVVLAVKPQMMEAALPQVVGCRKALFISIAAGKPIAWFAARLGPGARIIRSMPNTPAAVGKGVTAMVGGPGIGEADLALAADLLGAVGQVVTLSDEAQMDAVTALSGSGPAYVFHLIEAMAEAGTKAGLPADLAMILARQTVIGAGALAEGSTESAAQLRINVTSPGGTTAAALSVLMAELPALMTRTIAAAQHRSRELAG